MKLYKQEPATIELGDRVYRYRNDFRTFLRLNTILKDEDITDADKLTWCSENLFFGEKENVSELIEAYLEHYNGRGKKGQKVFDLEQDAEYIYASFWQIYGIDLFSAELTAEQFLALMRGLPKGCRMSEIVEIRQMEIPAPNKYNSKQRATIAEAKRAVALHSENGDNPFGNFGQTIAELAGNGRSGNRKGNTRS